MDSAAIKGMQVMQGDDVLCQAAVAQGIVIANINWKNVGDPSTSTLDLRFFGNIPECDRLKLNLSDPTLRIRIGEVPLDTRSIERVDLTRFSEPRPLGAVASFSVKINDSTLCEFDAGIGVAIVGVTYFVYEDGDYTSSVIVTHLDGKKGEITGQFHQFLTDGDVVAVRVESRSGS